MWIHAHVGFWTLTIILFILSYIFAVTGKPKPQKILHMILRLLYVLTVITGGVLLSKYYSVGSAGWPTVKALFGLLVIAMMEMTLIKTTKKKSATMFWVLLVIGLLGVFYIGYSVLG